MMTRTRKGKIADIKNDPENANKGTPEGMKALGRSMRDYGAGRSVLVDKNQTLIAGEKATTTAKKIGIEDVIIVPTDGTKLVVVQRTDLDLELDQEARELAYADNAVAHLDLDFDQDQIDVDIEKGIDIAWLGLERSEEDGEFIDEPELEIGPELFERHDYIVMYFDNEFDWNVACELFGIKTVKCGKVGKKTIEHKGMGRVIRGDEVLRMLQDG